MRIDCMEALRLLAQGEVLAVPTETVYGLAADPTNASAVEKVFKLKGRSAGNPLTTLVAGPEQVAPFTKLLPPYFTQLAQAFWPGPLTLVIPVLEGAVLPAIRAGLPSAGFRVPAQDQTLELLRAYGPLVAPSANLSGGPSATRPEHIAQDFGTALPVLEGEAGDVGVESTILIWTGLLWELVRPGALLGESFQVVLGYIPKPYQNAPSEKLPHYQPTAKLQHGARRAAVVVGYAERSYPDAEKVYNLGSLDSPESILQQLYGVLRQLDEDGVKEAWVDLDLPAGPLWDLIRQRLSVSPGELK